jgi:phosphoglycolate phosphatase
VFDLDGTLAATAGDVLTAVNHVLSDAGFAKLDTAHTEQLVRYAHGARSLVEGAFRIHGVELDAVNALRFVDLYFDHYAGCVADTSTLYAGCGMTLHQLRREGYLLAVCTNKPERHSRLLLDALGIGGRFTIIAGRDTFPYRKPDPRHLLCTIAEAGGDITRAVMIGDSEIDVATARAAGIPVVAVSFGYGPSRTEELEADRIARSYAELPSLVSTLLEHGI